MPLTLKQLLVRQDWAGAFGPRTIERGARYARQGRVAQIELLPESDGEWLFLEGSVHGSGRNIYQCQVDLSPAPDELLVDGLCTCPVEFDCKHAVAMLYAIAHDLVRNPGNLPTVHLGADNQHPLDDAETRLQRWRDWFEHPHGREHERLVADAGRQFGILLGASFTGEYLRAAPVWMRPSRKKSGNGGLVDPRPLTLSERSGPIPTPAGGFCREDASALSHLLNAPVERHKNRDWYVASQDHVGRALKELVARHPAYYERGSRALERGPDISAGLEWIEYDDGRQKLAPACADEAHRLILRAHDMWYIDINRDRYGHINDDPDILVQASRMPEIAPHQIKEVRRQLRKSPLAITLPVPQLRKRGADIEASPVPVLRVDIKRLSNFHTSTSFKAGYARLYFDYDGALIEASDCKPVMQRIIGKRLHTVHGDEKAEIAHGNTLIEYGFLPMGSLPGYRWLGEDNADPWRYWLLAPDDNKTPLPPEDWAEPLAALSEQGFRIEYGPDFPRSRPVEVEDWHAELTPSEAGHAWFDVALGIDVEGERIDMLPLLRRLIGDPTFPRQKRLDEKKDATWTLQLDEERYIELPLERLRAMVEPLLEWLEGDENAIPRVHGTELAALDDTAIAWQGGRALRKQLKRLATARQANPPRALRTTLRPYQRDGLAWLNFLADAGLGGILADDMGLGKTIQVLAHILCEKQRRRLKQPALVVAPTSLLGNWASEAARFTPTLKVLVLHGNQRHGAFERIDDHNLVITTYPLLPRDQDTLADKDWSLMVLDEAQAIKNARSRTAQAVRAIPAARRIAMTGTPLENHLGELWAQFDAVEPGLLGGEKHFRRHYRTPIEKHGDAERQRRLNRRIGSLLLRRRKDDVLAELPAKNNIVRHIELTGAQRQLYETLRLAQHKRVRNAVAQRGLAQSGIIVLDALLKLRQACCDPRLVKLASARKVKHSAKLDALLELLDELVDEGRRILVFSQFTTMLELVHQALQTRGIEHQALTGQTPGKQRAGLVRRFQNGRFPVFLISLKAGGVGLNLTAADTVIHYDPWWNPAVENQATDRAHRIGQDKPVFVYRLISADTVEEKIQAMQARKAELAKAVLEGGSSKKLRFDTEDIEALFGSTGSRNVIATEVAPT